MIVVTQLNYLLWYTNKSMLTEQLFSFTFSFTLLLTEFSFCTRTQENGFCCPAWSSHHPSKNPAYAPCNRNRLQIYLNITRYKMDYLIRSPTSALPDRSHSSILNIVLLVPFLLLSTTRQPQISSFSSITSPIIPKTKFSQ